MWTKQEMVVLAVEIASKYGLDPVVVCCMCHHESNDWNRYAGRYEPAFYRRYIEPMQYVKTFGPTISRDTERIWRATSWGLMQIMGQTAREYGFMGEYLSELADPNIGIDYGCQRFAKALKSKGNNLREALLNYNGGSNAIYPDLVLRHLPEYQKGDNHGN